MLTRTDLHGTVQFEFDGMDMIRERSGSSQAAYDSAACGATSTSAYAGGTTWFVVNGELLSFQRQGMTYKVFGDLLGSVRLVTDSSGATVFSASYDAWGNTLSVTDLVPGGMPYKFVGIYGCRRDADTGLTYMRQRWYDTGLQRFVSRDQVRGTRNRYSYAKDCPTVFIDTTGLAPTLPFGGGNKQMCEALKRDIADKGMIVIHKVLQMMFNTEADPLIRRALLGKSKICLPWYHRLGMRLKDSVQGHIRILWDGYMTPLLDSVDKYATYCLDDNGNDKFDGGTKIRVPYIPPEFYKENNPEAWGSAESRAKVGITVLMIQWLWYTWPVLAL